MAIQDYPRDDGEPPTTSNTGSAHSLQGRWKWAVIPVLLILVFNVFFIPLSPHPANAQAGYLTAIRGTVLDKLTGRPVSGASISLPDLGLESWSDSLGRFSFNEVTIPSSEYQTDITVRADGFGEWHMLNILLVSVDTLILDVELESSPVTISIPEIIPLERSPQVIQSLADLSVAPTIDQTNAPLPDTIRVRVTGQVAICDPGASYTVEVIDFKDYVKHVLPYEWIRTWPRESLRAGAMAAKMYAWDIIGDGGRYEDADVFDSVCDQVYIPGATYSSTNNAIEFTWNWRLNHADGRLFRTHYLDWYWRCQDYGWQGYCMGQWDTYYHATGNNGREKLTWDEMLFEYYWNSELSYVPIPPPAGFNLRFFGNGWGDFDRAKILVDDPATGGLPVDVGDGDMTIEWWMLAREVDNPSPSCTPGGDNWTDGNVIFDRDVDGAGDHGEYGIALSGGSISFGVGNGSDSETICASTDVADGNWHHIAVTRRYSDGLMRIFVDGVLDGEGVGPAGDISYRDGRSPGDPDQDPYLILGARKSDVGLAFSGVLDEIRISNVLRYTENFQPSQLPFTTDGNTMALYHFDRGYGNAVFDSSGASGGPSDGIRLYGGDPQNGPEWQFSLLFLFHQLYIPVAVE